MNRNGVRRGKELTKEQIYRKIWEMVKKHGFSQKEACEKYGINEKTFSGWKMKQINDNSSVIKSYVPVDAHKKPESEVSSSSEKLSPFQLGRVKYCNNCLGNPLRIHQNVDIIIEGFDVRKKFDADLLSTGLMAHQLTSGIVTEYYKLRDHISSDTVRHLKYVKTNGKSNQIR
jgi:hypothetical protein